MHAKENSQICFPPIPIEFTTNPNFLELIFNVLTIVGILMIAPRKTLEYSWVRNIHWMTIL